MKLLIPILIGLMVAGCGQSQDQNEKWINEIIAGGLSERTEILEDNVFSDYKVYRDGNNDGVCYEYIFSEEPSEDERSQVAGAIRGELIAGVRTITLDDQVLKAAMENGVYIRFIYKTPDGGVIVDQVVTSSDL